MNIENAISTIVVLVLAITFAIAIVIADIRVIKKRQNELLNELRVIISRPKEDINNESD
jgi:hypothetical protein